MAEQRRVVAITGAGPGLGRSLAIAFGQAGFDVAIIARTLSKLEETAAMVPGRCLPVVADLTDPDAVRAAFRRIGEELGGLDVLINNAGRYTPVPLDEAGDDLVRNLVDINFTAAIWCTREALPMMRARGGGDFVNISTQSVETPQPYMIIYGAAKGAVESFSQGLRYELAGEDFRVMVFQLGSIADTDVDPEFIRLSDRFVPKLAAVGLDKAFILPGTKPADIADAIVHAVQAPRAMYTYTVRLRGG
jgi:NAD(P)-dependent dehydrogenase (short-subunit alcohol dehydrogenase family)